MVENELEGPNSPSFAPRSFSMEASDDRFIVDASTVSMAEMSALGYTVIHELSDEIGYVVVKGEESWMPDGAEFTPDIQIDIGDPSLQETDESETTTPDSLTALQWDKREQDIGEIDATGQTTEGERARIGIIDSGVLGANPNREVTHPDLTFGDDDNSRKVLEGTPVGDEEESGPSYNFTGDGKGPGPRKEGDPSGDPHGTECAGTAAAVDDRNGIVGFAPDAEVVDLRVFIGGGGTFGDIIAATVVGATPRSETVEVTVGGTAENEETTKVRGSGCDVLNLSLGGGALVPLNRLASDETPPFDPSLPGPLIGADPAIVADNGAAIGSAAIYALENGALPVASAGNSAIGLGIPLSDDRQSPRVQVDGVDSAPVTFPACAPGYLTVSATGPIGYGWPSDRGLEFPIQTELPADEPAVYSNYGGADQIEFDVGGEAVTLADEGTSDENRISLGTAVDVSAGGGNLDVSTFLFETLESGAFPGVNNDRLFTTAFEQRPKDPDDPPAEEIDPDGPFAPNFTRVLGTSFSAPNVSGLAALLAGEILDQRPTESEAGDGELTQQDPLTFEGVQAIRTVIENTAQLSSVGRAGETSAPSVAAVNSAVGASGFAPPFVDVPTDGDTPSRPGSVPGRLDPADHRGNGHYNVQDAIERLRALLK